MGADYMKAVGSAPGELTVEERNLLSVAYKNAVGSRRASWRIISSVEQKEQSKGNDANVGHAKAYRAKVEAELQGICDTILALLSALMATKKVLPLTMRRLPTMMQWELPASLQ